MQDDPITRALREAQTHAVGRDGEDIPAAPIIAAFLRALPGWNAKGRWRPPYNMALLAAAVERAAQEQGGGDG